MITKTLLCRLLHLSEEELVGTIIEAENRKYISLFNAIVTYMEQRELSPLVKDEHFESVLQRLVVDKLISSKEVCEVADLLSLAQTITIIRSLQAEGVLEQEVSKQEDQLVIYTDGSCLKNPDGPSGWGYVIVDDEEIVKENSGGIASSTNNRAELMAVIRALDEGKSSCYIFTDSKYVINCAKGEWKRSKNTDLWAEYEEAVRGQEIEWSWVKGHSNNRFNERVDALAREAAIRIRL